MYLFKRGLLPNYFRDMFTLASQLNSHYTTIATFFTYLPVELISETSQFGFKDLCFSTR